MKISQEVAVLIFKNLCQGLWWTKAV